MELSRTKKVILGVTIVILALVLMNEVVFHQAFKEDYEIFRAVKQGMSEAQVVSLLGAPYKVYHRATAPKNYYVEGYSFKVRPITNKVFIYIGNEPIAYVYFDDKNRVEELFVGGS